MITAATTLHDALRQFDLTSRADNSGPLPRRVLVQKGRDVGQMTAQTGWCFIRLMQGEPTDTYPRNVVTLARRLLAGVDRPA